MNRVAQRFERAHNCSVVLDRMFDCTNVSVLYMQINVLSTAQFGRTTNGIRIERLQ